MKKYAYFDDEAQAPIISNFNPADLGVTEFIEVDGSITPNDIYFKGGVIKFYPAKPTEFHVWDDTVEEWINKEIDFIGSIRANGLSIVYQMSDQVFGSFVSPMKGQEVKYLMKRYEADKFLTDPDPVLTEYPLIMSETAEDGSKTGRTPFETAQVYLNLGAIYVQAMALLEGMRITAVNKIETAGSKADVDLAIFEFSLGISNSF